MIQPKPAKNNCLKPSSSSLNLPKTIVMPPLPLEIWKLIFSYMDFTLLQKIATLVCYEWLYIIRNDRFLSGHLLVSKKGLNVPDINLVLQNFGINYLILIQCENIAKRHFTQSFPTFSARRKIIRSFVCPVFIVVQIVVPSTISAPKSFCVFVSA